MIDKLELIFKLSVLISELEKAQKNNKIRKILELQILKRSKNA